METSRDSKLLEALNELRQRIGTFRHEIKVHRDEIEALERQLEQTEGAARSIALLLDLRDAEVPMDAEPLAARVEAPNDGMPSRPKGRKSPTKERAYRMAIEVLREANRPMDRAELLHAFSERGFVPKVVGPAKYIGKILWQDSRFEHIDGKGYWLAGEKVPNNDAVP